MRKLRHREVKEHAQGHMAADKLVDLNQVFRLQSPTGLSATAPQVFTRYVPSPTRAQPNLSFQNKMAKGISQPDSLPLPQFAQRSPGPG